MTPQEAERPATETGEADLWAQAVREERELEDKLKSYEDQVIAQYLARLGVALTPDDARATGSPSLTFLVLPDPTLGAFAMPNGRIYVHTGLLAWLADETQLATILGHAIAHVTNRHALRFAREDESRPPLFTVPAPPLSPAASVILGRGLRLAATAAMRGYGRDLERQAVADSLASLVRDGYDVREAPRTYERLRDETKDRGALETFLLANPQYLTERIEDARGLVQTRYANVVAPPRSATAAPEFRMRMRIVTRENARLDIQAERFPLAAAQLDGVLALAPRDAIAQLYYGDLYRLESQRSGDAADRADKARKAMERYERAAQLDPAYADPFRQLGLLYYQQKDRARAKQAFEKYLALRPDAPDAGRIKGYLVEIDR